jgi:hypothetical protein
MGQRTLNDIARTAHRNNLESGVSGLLIFSEGQFIQILEGDTVEILQLVANIGVDKRNTNLKVLWHGSQRERQFPDWTMGCFDMTASDAPEFPSQFIHNALTQDNWTDQMTSVLRRFYIDNRLGGLEPVFTRMRKIS